MDCDYSYNLILGAHTGNNFWERQAANKEAQKE